MTPLLVPLVLAVSMGRIPVPPRYAAQMEAHLATIQARAWAVAVPGDLHHGHLLLRAGAPTEFKGVGQLFAWSVGVLYHSDEMLTRWRLDDGDLPVRQRRPRSIVAYWSGEVLDAATLVADPLMFPHYEGHGTIHLDELAGEHAGQLDLRHDRFVAGRHPCLVDQIIDFGGFPRRMTMECYVR